VVAAELINKGENRMNPIQALNILATCAGQAPLPAAAHDQWRQAFKVLNDKLQEENKWKKDQPNLNAVKKPEEPKVEKTA
jgi:hypothetical protein